MEFETVADELYGLLPSEFTATRDARARTARREGDRELARRISALRKPTLAAWAANLLVRTAPEERDRFLALGEELRSAYQDLDGDQLRELAGPQRRLAAALTRSARDAAAEAGQPLGDGPQHEVEQTLQAALTDADAAAEWAAGHLAKPLTPPTGFTDAALEAVPARPGSGAPKRKKAARKEPGRKESGREEPGAGRVADLDQARDRRRKQTQEADEARRAADEAGDEARRLDEERTSADDGLSRAKDRRKAADDRITAAREELRAAEHAQRDAADAEREARDRAREATRAARQADRTARRAADKADRITRDDRNR